MIHIPYGMVGMVVGFTRYDPTGNVFNHTGSSFCMGPCSHFDLCCMMVAASEILYCVSVSRLKKKTLKHHTIQFDQQC